MHSREFVPAKKKLSLILAHDPLTGLCSGQRTKRRGPWRHGAAFNSHEEEWNVDWFSSLLCAFVYFRIPLSMCNNVASSLAAFKSVPAPPHRSEVTIMECLWPVQREGRGIDWQTGRRVIKGKLNHPNVGKRDSISSRDNYTRLTRSPSKQAIEREPQKRHHQYQHTTKISSLCRMFCPALHSASTRALFESPGLGKGNSSDSCIPNWALLLRSRWVVMDLIFPLPSKLTVGGWGWEREFFSTHGISRNVSLPWLIFAATTRQRNIKMSLYNRYTCSLFWGASIGGWRWIFAQCKHMSG